MVYSMKKRVISLLTAVATVLSLFQSLATFAATDAIGIYGWNCTSGNNEALCSLSSDYYHAGNHSAKLSSEVSGASVTLKTDISVQQDKTYKVSFWAKSQNSSTLTVKIGNSTYNLLSLMTTYNWTKFEYSYTHKENSGIVPIIFELNNVGTAYIDTVKVTLDEKGIQENLVKNPGFEEKGEAYVAAEVTPFAQTDMNTVMQTFSDASSMPLLYGDDIVIDGDMNEWNNYPVVSLPSKTREVNTMKDYSGEDDLSVDFMTAYDEKNLYIYAEVTDDVHLQPNVGERYWKGDSLQLAIGTVDEDYGIEVGFYLTDDGQSMVYSNELIKDLWGSIEDKVLELREKTVCKAYREGNKTYYEAQIPWMIKFDEIPDEFLLNLLINDDDGSGRGYFEWYPGIGGTKSNELFAVIFPIEKNNDVFAYIDTPRTLLEADEAASELYIYNLSETEQTIDVNIDNTESGEVSISSGFVYMWPFEVTAETVGNLEVSADLTYSGGSYNTKRIVPVIVNVPLELERIRENNLKELNDLRQKCHEQGIRTDYEDITINTIEMFIDYGLEDYNGARESRAVYVYECLLDLYNEAKADLTAYLEGTKEPKDAKYYQTSELEIKGKSIYADMLDTKTGEVKREPVFLSGYNNNNSDSTEMSTVGANLIQFEITMAQVIRDAEAPRGWSLNKQGGVDAKLEYSEDAYKGDYSIKIQNSSARQSNVYLALSTNVPLEGGKKYTLSFYAKGNGVSRCSYRPNAFKGEKLAISASDDWQKYTYTYEPEDDMTTELMFLCEDVTNELYIDNVRIVEKGTNNNLVKHGSFEEKPVVMNGYAVNVDRIMDEFIPFFDEAYKNNVQIDFLIAYHYLPTKLFRGDEWKSDGRYGVYLEDESVQDMLEAFFTVVTSLVKDHPALSSICISNEPGDWYGADERYRDDWQEYLKKLYNNDVSLMNKAYGTSFSSFEDVPFGKDDTDYNNDAIYYDYIVFNDEMFAAFTSKVASYVKAVAPDVPVHSKIMCVIYPAEPARSNSPLRIGTNPEMFAEFSDLLGNDGWNYMDTGRTLSNKMLWYDFWGSLKDVPVFNSEDHAVVDGDERYNDLYAPHYESDLWQGAVHGRTMTTIWKWGRTLATNNQTSANIKHRPDCVAVEGHTMLDLNRLSNEVSALQNVNPDVGIYYSYPSRIHTETHMSAVYETYRAIGNAGQRSKLYTEKMIKAGKLNEVKLLIIPNATSTEPEVLEHIKEFMESGGTVLLVGDCFKYDDHKGAFENTDTLNYILANSGTLAAHGDGNLIVFDEDIHERIRTLVKNVIGSNIEVIDADTGLPVDESEWFTVEYDGKTLLNIIYMNREAGRNITIKIDGVPVFSAVELIEGDTLGEKFYINGYDPMLIRIEK